MPGQAHNDLTLMGAKWLRKQGFPIVATELFAAGSRERADVIGFRSNCSAMIEVKVSRRDFAADKRKVERHGDGIGVGVYRFYLCPYGLVHPDEVPPRWGLLYAGKQGIESVIKPNGNGWPVLGSGSSEWRAIQHAPCPLTERATLFSIARRWSGGNILTHLD